MSTETGLACSCRCGPSHGRWSQISSKNAVSVLDTFCYGSPMLLNPGTEHTQDTQLSFSALLPWTTEFIDTRNNHLYYLVPLTVTFMKIIHRVMICAWINKWFWDLLIWQNSEIALWESKILKQLRNNVLRTWTVIAEDWSWKATLLIMIWKNKV